MRKAIQKLHVTTSKCSHTIIITDMIRHTSEKTNILRTSAIRWWISRSVCRIVSSVP